MSRDTSDSEGYQRAIVFDRSLVFGGPDFRPEDKHGVSYGERQSLDRGLGGSPGAQELPRFCACTPTQHVAPRAVPLGGLV